MAERVYAALQPITRMLRVTLIVLTALEAANLVLMVLQYWFVSEFQRTGMSAEALSNLRSNGFLIRLVAIPHSLALLVMVIMFLRWIYRAMVNVHAFGASEAYSPGMAVGGFFIPFANFVIPCIAMSEI